ncbi:RagB/SusD family nutrient uptake outer membrane protein [Mariniflexile ostreae]|uniref:RagB/SusD family nutrient uptake outer membrane protein n=1 Tax=Mariniflexile ostreae TaxID=1520892 RepID=A0ABV5FF69_9FLAO
MKNILFVFGLLVLVAGCQDSIDLNPISDVGTTNFYNNEDECQLALNGVYNFLGDKSVYESELGIKSAYGTDEALYGRSNLNWPMALYVYNANTREIEQIWQALYSGINNANVLIENLPGADFNIEAKRTEMEAETRFLRALFYFELVRRWENVPLRVESVSTVEQANNIPATDGVDIYKFIISELEQVAPMLPEIETSHIGKATETAAYALLARIYLQKAGYPLQHESQSSYEKVVEYADKVITSGKHNLSLPYKQIFMQEIQNVHDFTEIIFEVQFENLFNEGLNEGGSYGTFTGIQTLYNPGPYCGGFSYVAVSLTNLYADDDERKSWNVADWKVRGTGKIQLVDKPEKNKYFPYRYYPGKFRRVDYVGEWSDQNLIELETGTISKNETATDFPVIRYADVILMKAEALNEISGPTEAVPFLNMVRNRAGLEDIDNTLVANKNMFLEELIDERSRELCFEGVRKMDLIRWGKLGEKLAKLKEDMEETEVVPAYEWLYTAPNNYLDKHNVWPIPLIEVEENNMIEQHVLWR